MRISVTFTELNWTPCSHSRNSFIAYLAPMEQPSARQHCNNLNREHPLQGNVHKLF